jgi:hypothetical protein
MSLPERLRPRTLELRGRGDLRRIETTLLVFIFLLLAAATVADLRREVHENKRLEADMRTWRALTGHDYQNIAIEQDLKGYTTRDVACGNTSPAPPGTQPQVCLVATGPVLADGHRAVRGGFYVPPYLQDVRENRYACFGTAVQEDLCGLATPPGFPATPLAGGSR